MTIAWLYAMPADFASISGTNLPGLGTWRRLFGIPAVGRDVWGGGYRVGLQSSLAVAGLAYTVFCASVVRGARVSSGWAWGLGLPLLAVVGVILPPVLSTDVFAYVGYARMPLVHGLNPHLTTQMELVRLGDVTAPFLRWPIASPYGPLWTLWCMTLVVLFPVDSVAGVVMALKMCGVLACVGLALGLRAWVVASSRRQSADGSAETTRVANASASQALGSTVVALVLFNPLLLLEGPGSAHNDLPMMAFLMAGLCATRVGRFRFGALLLGIAGGLKILPLLLLPALLLRRRGQPRQVLEVLTFGMLPVVLAYLPFWEGLSTFAGLSQRWQHEGGAAAARVATAAATWGRLASTVLPIVVVYVACLARLWQAQRARPTAFVPDDALTLDLWTFTALAVFLLATGIWFPWYLVWLWPGALVALLAWPPGASDREPGVDAKSPWLSVAKGLPRLLAGVGLWLVTALLLATYTLAPG